ncbi:5113_t:CDS:2, partial [Gigaspora rosea]
KGCAENLKWLLKYRTGNPLLKSQKRGRKIYKAKRRQWVICKDVKAILLEGKRYTEDTNLGDFSRATVTACICL